MKFKKLLAVLLTIVVMAGALPMNLLVVKAATWSSGGYADNSTALNEVKILMREQTTAYKLNRFDYILEEYPLSGYFNSEKFSPCKNHYSCSCGNSVSSTCIYGFEDKDIGKWINLRATQCAGYGNYCLYRFYGKIITSGITVSSANKSDGVKFKSYLDSFDDLTGTQFWVNNNHSLTYLAKDSTYIYFIDANSGGSYCSCGNGTISNCKINLRRFTYSNFVSRYTSITLYTEAKIVGNQGGSVTISLLSDKNTITNTNAILWGNVEKPSSYAVTQIGIKVRKSGSTYDNGWSKYEDPSWDYVGESIAQPYYNLNTELSLTLSPDTDYYYKIYAKVNGTDYWSAETKFTTTGSHSHTYPSSWTTVTVATCTTSGSAKRVCTSCGNIETKTLAALGHNYSNSYTIDKAATCTTDGLKSRHCTRCSSKTDVTVIAATGHNHHLDYENTHPHNGYYRCDCGDFYAADATTVNSCNLCFPVGKSVVTTEKEQYDIGNSIEISWSEAERATHYNLYVCKKDSDGLYSIVVAQENLLITNSYSIDTILSGLSVGEYKVSITSYDNTRYMADGSDWSYQESEPIYFTISTFVRYYDWTFDFDNATKMMSDAMTSGGDLSLALKEYNKGIIKAVDIYDDSFINHIEAPERPGYKFTGWKKLLEPNQSVYSMTYTHYIFQAQYEPLLYIKGECLYGDINFDEQINLLDLVRMKNILVGTFEYHVTTDLNADDITNALDISLLINLLLGTEMTKNVYFDANGGTVVESQRLVVCGQVLGELPIPTRTGYEFIGWYTKDGTEITSNTVMTFDNAITAIAHWSANSYRINWNTGTGYTITVKRSSSPYANASISALNNGDTIYYGDSLTITYSASLGYTLQNYGITSATVSGNLTNDDIYATAKVNNYTYNIVYKSSNGTNLGTDTIEHKFGTTNTISPKSFIGYNTPSSQSVKWDSLEKTITFTYSPIQVSTLQSLSNGAWGISGNIEFLTYSVSTEYRNRTSNSIQVRIIWTNTLLANYYYQRGQVFNATIGGKSTGNVTIAPFNTWASSSSSNRSLSGTSDWITVPVSATQTSISISADAYRLNSDGSLTNINESFSKSFNIPTY